MMRKMMLGACLLASALGVKASDGTIHFTGSITDQTCKVDTGSLNLPVNLGNVALTALNGAKGMSAASTQFSINVSECPETASAANVKFDGTVDANDPGLLALDNESGVASGVGIQIADKNGTAIPLHAASSDYSLIEGTNSLNFVARYVSTGPAVTVGSANGTSEFTIIYK